MCDSAASWRARGVAGGRSRKRAELNAETVQGPDGAGDSGAGDPERGGGWPCFRGVCGRAAGGLPGDRGHVRGYAAGGSGTPQPAVRGVPVEVWGAHSADPAGERERFFATEAAMAGASAGSQRREETCADDGDGGGALLSAGGGPGYARGNAGVAEQAGGRGAEALGNRG